jgi:hypothetical protein
MSLDKRVALIGPRFFSYLEAISAEFEKKGVFAITADDIHAQSIAWRVIYRLGLTGVYQRKLREYSRSLLLRLKEVRINHILFVNCETYDEKFLDACESANIKISVYFWDALKNKPIFAKYIDRFQRVASFDPGDCETFQLRYIPLFAEHEFFDSAEQTQRKFDACMVSTIHSGRAAWASELYRLGEVGANIKVFAFYSSKWLFFVRNVFRPGALALLRRIECVPLQKREVAELFRNSRDVIDVHHFKQRGLTSRTFEALAAGARLITTNTDVASLPANLRARTRVVKWPDELHDMLSEVQQLPPLTHEDRYFLSIERFVDELWALIDWGPAAEAATEKS